MSTDHNFWRARRAEADSNRGPSAYQPNALPLGQTTFEVEFSVLLFPKLEIAASFDRKQTKFYKYTVWRQTSKASATIAETLLCTSCYFIYLLSRKNGCFAYVPSQTTWAAERTNNLKGCLNDRAEEGKQPLRAYLHCRMSLSARR